MHDLPGKDLICLVFDVVYSEVIVLRKGKAVGVAVWLNEQEVDTITFSTIRLVAD